MSQSDTPREADADSYISCKQAARLMSFKRDRPLKPDEDGELKKHLMVCLNCQNFDRQLDVLEMLAKRYAAGGSPSLFGGTSTGTKG
jgi:hypothetical protein